MDFAQIKNCVWDIRILITKEPRLVYGMVTGVSIEGGYVLTCAHGFDSPYGKIEGRKRDQNFEGYIGFATAYVREDWDIRILKFLEKPKEKLVYLQISDNEELSTGDTLYGVGHPDHNDYTVYVNRVPFPSVKVSPSSFSVSGTCLNHVVDHREKRTRHRTMGDFYDKEIFERVRCDPSSEKLNPHVPVIFSLGTCEAGCSGGPILTKEGHIIGIVSCGTKGYINVSIHCSAIKALLAEFKLQKKGKKRPQESAHDPPSKKPFICSDKSCTKGFGSEQGRQDHWNAKHRSNAK